MPARFAHRALVLLALACCLLAVPAGAAAAGPRTWAYLSGGQAPAGALLRFDLLVLDGFNHPPLAREQGRPLYLGLVSAGEALPGTRAFDLAKDQPFVAGRNGEALILDLGSKAWQELLLDRLIPEVLAQGFDGVLLDTPDAGLARLQLRDSAGHAARRASIVAFLAELRKRFPQTRLAMNRGLALLPEAARSLDYLLVEELSSEYDVRSLSCRMVKPAVQQMLVAQVRKAQAANPGLVLLTLDYAAPEQKELAAEALRYARSKGFVPYVAGIDLERLWTHSLER